MAMCSVLLLHFCSFFNVILFFRIKFVKGSNLFTGSGTKYYHGFNVSLCGGDTTVTCSQNVTSEETYRKSNIPVCYYYFINTYAPDCMEIK